MARNRFDRNVWEEVIFSRVKVERKQTTEEICLRMNKDRIDGVGRDAVDLFPVCEGDEVDVVFLQLTGEMWARDIIRVYEQEGLQPDPLAQAVVNQTKLWEHNSMWNRTVWKKDDHYHSLAFGWCSFSFDVGAKSHRYVQFRTHEDRFDCPNRDGYWVVGSRLPK